jgi:hypothetical protein
VREGDPLLYYRSEYRTLGSSESAGHKR